MNRSIQSQIWKTRGLYDLSADIEEKANVAAQHPEIVQKLAGYAEQAHTPNTWGEWIDKSKSFRPAPAVKFYAP